MPAQAMQTVIVLAVLFGGALSLLPIIHAIRSGQALIFFGVLGIIIASGITFATAPAAFGVAPAATLWAAAYLASVFADYTAGSEARRERQRRKAMQEAPPVGQSQQAPRRRE